MRQNIRDKYGIEKKQPTKKSDKQTAAMMEELRKEYGMDDEDAKELKNKMDKVRNAPPKNIQDNLKKNSQGELCDLISKEGGVGRGGLDDKDAKEPQIKIDKVIKPYALSTL